MEEDGWWILVGGRRRLGRCLAESLGRDHRLVLTSSASWEGEGWTAGISKGAQARLLRWDADSPTVAEQMMADIRSLREDGIRPRCAVILAGSFPRAPLGTWDAADLEATWRLNLTFPLLAAQALAPWIEDGGVLQFVLDAAIHRPFLGRLPYTAAKAGLAALVPGLARALAPRIRVAGHALGVVLPGEGDDPAALADLTLLGRTGDPSDVARALRFVAESPTLTGEILTQDGGRRWA